jgi:hypothetical protein
MNAACPDGRRLRPPTRHARVGKDPAEGPPDPAEEPVGGRRERCEPETAQDPGQPPGGRDVLEETNRRRAVHHPHAARLDELPRLTDLRLGDTRRIGRGRFVVAAQERESLSAVQPGDEPRRRATERSTAVEQQERPARRRDVPEPRRIEDEAVHESAQYRRDPPRHRARQRPRLHRYLR